MQPFTHLIALKPRRYYILTTSSSTSASGREFPEIERSKASGVQSVESAAHGSTYCSGRREWIASSEILSRLSGQLARGEAKPRLLKVMRPHRGFEYVFRGDETNESGITLRIHVRTTSMRNFAFPAEPRICERTPTQCRHSGYNASPAFCQYRTRRNGVWPSK